MKPKNTCQPIDDFNQAVKAVLFACLIAFSLSGFSASVNNKPFSPLLKAKTPFAKTPKISRVSYGTCLRPGARITIYGSGFFPKGLRSVVLEGTSHIHLGIVSWTSNNIVASVPGNARLPSARSVVLVMEERTHKRYISNRILLKTCVLNLGLKAVPLGTGRRPGVPTSPGSTNIPGATGTSNLPGTPAGTLRPPGNSTGNANNPSPNNPNNPGANNNNAGGNNYTPPGATSSNIPPAPQVSFSATKQSTKRGKIVPNEIVIVNDNMNQAESIRKALSAQGYSILRRKRYRVLNIVISVFRKPSGATVAQSIQALRQQYPKIRIDANHYYNHLSGEPSASTKLIRWKSNPERCGRGVKIGLLDSNVESSHPAFRGRRLIKKNFNTRESTQPTSLHGTSIASIWLGNPKSSEFNGIVPSATVYSAVVFYKQNKQVRTSTTLLMEGFEWLLQQRVDAINMSFGGPYNQIMDAAILQTSKRNVALVAAVGNQGSGKPPLFPASHKNVVGVTAVNLGLRAYRHANQGKGVELAAPGVNIKVAYPGNRSSMQSGTSYAAPFVTASLALLKKKYRSASKARAVLRKSTKDLGSRGRDSVYGWGLIQTQQVCR